MAGNDMMMIVVLLGAFLLFKDEIMGIFNDVKGGLGGAGGGETAPVETEAAEPVEAETEEAEGGGKRTGAGERMKKHRDARKGRRKRGGGGKAKGGESYFGIANV